jgi:hypothetical protein
MQPELQRANPTFPPRFSASSQTQMKKRERKATKKETKENRFLDLVKSFHNDQEFWENTIQEHGVISISFCI